MEPRFRNNKEMKVSVIIPCHNSEKFIAQAINSAIAQTYDNIEIILVDNASTDSTYQKLLEFQSRFPTKIRVFQEPKKGASSARNKGLSESNGEWIQFLDADDVILPNKIENQISIIKGECVLLVGDYIVIRNRGELELQDVVLANPDKWAGLISSKLGITSSNLFSKSSLDEIGGWDERLESSQEYDLMFRLLKSNGKVCYSSALETKIYKGVESISATDDDDRFRIILHNILELRRRMKLFLISTGQYSDKLDRVYGEFVFKKLWMHRRRLPVFFKENIKKEKLNVSILIKFKIVANYYLKGLRIFRS